MSTIKSSNPFTTSSKTFWAPAGTKEILRLAKKLFRAVLAHYLDGRTLQTREVLASMRR